MSRITFLTYVHGLRKTLREAIHEKLDGAPDYYDGKLEALQARYSQLEELFIGLVESLPARQQVEFADTVLYASEVEVE